jgi:hypothetical protein
MKILILLLIYINVFANVGAIYKQRGEASIIRNGEPISSSEGMKLEESDIITTKENGKVVVKFKDNTLISIGQKSKFSINEYTYEDNIEAEKIKVKLGFLSGKFKSITGKIGKIAPKKFQLNTRTATIGIRGTKIVMDIQPNFEHVACTEGKIVVLDSLGNSLDVLSGMMVSISKNKKSSNPKKYEAKQIEKIEKEFIKVNENVEVEIQLENEKESKKEKAETDNSTNSEVEENEEVDNSTNAEVENDKGEVDNSSNTEEIVETNEEIDNSINTEVESNEGEVDKSTTNESNKVKPVKSTKITKTKIQTNTIKLDDITLTIDLKEVFDNEVEEEKKKLTEKFDLNKHIDINKEEEKKVEGELIIKEEEVSFNDKKEYVSLGNEEGEMEWAESGIKEYEVGSKNEKEVMKDLNEIYKIYGEKASILNYQLLRFNNKELNYNGRVEGINKLDNSNITNGKFSLNIEFGVKANEAIKGNVNFDSNNKNWDIDIKGTKLNELNPTFTTNQVSATKVSQVELNKGNINGEIYKNDLSSIGGKIYLESKSNGTILGVYQGKK